MTSQITRGELLRRGAGAAGALAVLGPLGLRSAAADAADVHASYTYNLWNFDNADSLKLDKAAYAAASKMVKSAQVKFKISNLTGSGATLYPSKIVSLIQAGQAPDTWESWGGTLAAPYLKAHGAHDLSDWFKKYNWNKKLSSGAINFLSVNGKPYGVPYVTYSIPVFYNKKLFAQAGITPPTTYDQWEANNNALVKAGITPMSEAVIDGWDIMRLFEHLLEVTAGPKLHDQLINLQTGWNKPQVADAFGLLKKWGDQWLEKGYIGTNANDSTLLFTGGKVAQQLQGSWVTDQIKGGGGSLDDYGLFVPPGDKGPARMAGFAQQYMVSSKLSGPKLDALGEFFNAFVSVPVQSKILNTPSTATIGGFNGTGQPLLASYVKGTQTGKLYTIQDQAFSPALSNAYFAIQAGVGKGDIAPKDAAAQMDAAITKNKQ
jgi:raffinose/stachyose/melibiose transport system substrate-binding protein